MSNRFFLHPILNSPYECPQRHWKLDTSGQPTHARDFALAKINRAVGTRRQSNTALAKTTKKTATRDSMDLKARGIVEQFGHRGPGVHCVLARKRDNGDMNLTPPNGDMPQDTDRHAIVPNVSSLQPERKTRNRARNVPKGPNHEITCGQKGPETTQRGHLDHGFVLSGQVYDSHAPFTRRNGS